MHYGNLLEEEDCLVSSLYWKNIYKAKPLVLAPPWPHFLVDYDLIMDVTLLKIIITIGGLWLLDNQFAAEKQSSERPKAFRAFKLDHRTTGMYYLYYLFN